MWSDRAWVVAVLVAVVGVCSSADAATYEVEPTGSRVLAVTRRAGLFGFLGHDHAIEGEAVSGSVTFGPEAPPGERIEGEILIDAAALTIDMPEARKAAGLRAGPSEEDVREVRARFRGPEGLDTGRFETIRLRLTGAQDQAGGLVADPAGVTRISGELTLHGRTRPVSLPVEVEPTAPGLVVRGRTRLRQTDFGIVPATVAGGLVKVRDEVEVSFEVHLARRSP